MSSVSHELALIEWIRARVGDDPRLAVGIGDDAALLRTTASGDCLVAVDMLMEGVHFTVPPATPRDVGRKALAVNLSDMAAMAGRPAAAVVSVALPRPRGTGFARDLHDGLCELAEEYGLALAGGDTNVWDGPLVISVTVLGEPTGNRPVLRNGALVGDWIFVTGHLGGSLAAKHLRFQPRVREAIRLHESVDLHAMIDVSDGLAADLHHVLDESRVGAVLQAERIPVSPEVPKPRDDKSAVEHALCDGEDFELLFTVSPADGRRLLDDSPVELTLSHIGEIVAEGRRELVDAQGHGSPLLRAGWEHQF